MEELLTFIVKNICSQKDNIKITKIEDEGGIVTFIISVNEEDKGRVIGKAGRTIKAIRTILSVLAKKEGKTVLLQVE